MTSFCYLTHFTAQTRPATNATGQAPHRQSGSCLQEHGSLIATYRSAPAGAVDATFDSTASPSGSGGLLVVGEASCDSLSV